MKKNVKVTLNGNTVYGYEGQRILDLCAECGVEVPTLCYDPHLSLHGGCSVCLVEVEGAKTLLRACANTITPGMVIKTDTERAVSARRTALELLLSDHVGDCRPPCTLACPGQGNVQGYVNLAAQGKYGESLDALHHHVTLPSCIGRVCPAPCEKVCRRRFVDDAPVSIREIKRFVGDWGINSGRMGFVPEIEENGKRVAIVGGGSAGVSAAYYLRLKGYKPVIFEKERLLGGMMRYGIPDYRLPQRVLQTEIDWLLSHGIEVRTETALGRDVSLDELRKEFDAVILAMGCWKSSPMRVAGEDLDGVVGGIDFLYDVKTNPNVKVGARVVVVGGGNTAMDAARSARRLGAEKVFVLYRRSREEMPAEDIEIVEAGEEGVEFIYLSAPKTIEGARRVERILCEKMELGEPDASGRRSPVPTGETFVLEADMVIAAIGQGTDFSGLPSDLHDGRRMKVGKDYDTALPGVFVCGDQQTGPKIAIEAIGNGHWAADSVDHYLTHGTPKKPFFYDIVREDLGPEDFTHIVRSVQEEVPHVPGETRLKMKFDEYSAGLSEEQTLRDANRCMECGCQDVFECKLRKYATTHEARPEKLAGAHIEKIEDANPYYARNLDKCILCAKCVRACDEVAGFHAIDFAKRGFESVLTPQFFHDMEHSDCTFCGLCTQVCPVGALIENRVGHWPHLEEPLIIKTTCMSCPVGCELEMNLDRGRSRIVRVTTDLDDPEAPTGGDCCVRGRYSFKGMDLDGNFDHSMNGAPVSPDEAIAAFEALASEKDAAFVVGPSLTEQEVRAIVEFAKLRAPGARISMTADAELAPHLREAARRDDIKRGAYSSLNAVSPDGIARHGESDAFLLVGTNTDEDQPVLTSWLRRAVRHKKSPLVYVGETPGLLDKGDALILRPSEGKAAWVLQALAAAIKGGEVQDAVLEGTGVSVEQIKTAAAMLGGAKKPLTLIGGAAPASEAFDAAASLNGEYLLLFKGTGSATLLASGEKIVDTAELRANANAPLIFLGATPEEAGFEAADLAGRRYAVATSKLTNLSEKAKILIPLLPWTEKDGEAVNLEGRRLVVRRGPLTAKTGRGLCSLLAEAAMPLGGKIHSNPVATE